MTPFAQYSNEELISLAYRSPNATKLELEFAFRLENHYADGVKVMPDDSTEAAIEEIKFG